MKVHQGRRTATLVAICAAVVAGFAVPGTRAVTAQTGAWSVVPSPNSGAANVLNAIACAGPSDCWAVGSSAPASALQTLIEHWDGTSWTVVSSPNADVTQDNYLTAVTCASTSECWAVGYYQGAGCGCDEGQTLIERWNGTAWAIDTTLTNAGLLSGVVCDSPLQCWIAGHYLGTSARQTLIEQWSGTSWTVTPSANTDPTRDNFLSGVACPSPTMCWAAGYWSAPAGYEPLTERWDGTSWTIVASPSTSSSPLDIISGVACTGVSDCWIAGASNAPTGNVTLIEHWNGTAWSIVNSPNISNTTSELFAITCSSSTDCWAAGADIGGGIAQTSSTLTEHFDGSSWSIVSSPNPGGTDALYSVTCVSAGSCWASGVTAAPFVGGGGQTLIEQFTGAAGGGSADLSVALTAPRSTGLGDTIDYTLTVSNLGPSSASAVHVELVLPDGADLVSGAGSPAWDAHHHAVRWLVPSLSPGAHATFTVRVALDELGLVKAIGVAFSPTSDPNPHNNVALTTTRVRPLASSAYARAT